MPRMGDQIESVFDPFEDDGFAEFAKTLLIRRSNGLSPECPIDDPQLRTVGSRRGGGGSVLTPISRESSGLAVESSDGQAPTRVESGMFLTRHSARNEGPRSGTHAPYAIGFENPKTAQW